MDNKTVVITEKNGEYEIQNNGISEFALIGILECILFDMKTGRSKELPANQTEIRQPPNEITEEPRKAVAQESKAPELRTRISNAVKAIRELGGNLEDTDLSSLTDEELQSELDELTHEYKRLKSTKGNK
jgi:predicted  nucleic acid-binding Zn-ribbon protein